MDKINEPNNSILNLCVDELCGNGSNRGYVGANVMLKAPDSWWELSPEDQIEITNGCGPEAIEPVVPDSLWGLSIEAACRIHDYCYREDVDCDKWEADYMFLHNMIELIEQGSWWLRVPRLHVALGYFKAVRKWGRKRGH